MDSSAKPLCNKCSKSITVKVLQCVTCERQFHPNCLQKYAAVKDTRSCCFAAYSAIRSQLAAPRKSDRQAPLIGRSHVLIFLIRHVALAM